jgi:drug/metabolite transporter (DMT)-like permease
MLAGMWLIYSLGAAILWGINYAASGRVMNRGVAPAHLFLLDLVFAVTVIGGITAAAGKGRYLLAEVRHLGPDWIWLATAMVCSTAGGLAIFKAIDSKNATLASLIEVSYPFFVAVFAWLFFRETQFNWPTVLGGGLILAGVAVVYLGNPH